MLRAGRGTARQRRTIADRRPEAKGRRHSVVDHASARGGEPYTAGSRLSKEAAVHRSKSIRNKPTGDASRPSEELAFARSARPGPGSATTSADDEIASPRPTPGRALVSAVPPHSSLPPSETRSAVVQGFGPEVAIASPGPTDRPGGTRRRNHPVDASALPGMTPPPPPTLEERAALTDEALRPAVLPDIYGRNGRLLTPAPLRGSREVLIHQNTMAASDGLERIHDDAELDRLRTEHQLVGFPVSASLHVNDDLPVNRRYARPWTVLFAESLARDFYGRFHQPLQVNSAVRTVSYQARLQRVNGNAAAIDGDTASPHLTGQAIDLAKRGMSAAEIAWMRAYLMPLMQAGKIDVEEEFQQSCFHISVYRRFAGERRPVQAFAQLHPTASTAPKPLSEDSGEPQ